MLQPQAGGIQQCMSWREAPAVKEDQQAVSRATKYLSGASNIKNCNGAGCRACRYCIGRGRYCEEWIITILKGKSICFSPQFFSTVKPGTTEPWRKWKMEWKRSYCLPHSAAHIMLCNVRPHILWAPICWDSQNNNKFAVLSIDTRGVGFSLWCCCCIQPTEATQSSGSNWPFLLFSSYLTVQTLPWLQV